MNAVATSISTSPSNPNPSPRPVIHLGKGQGEDVWFLDNLLTIKVRGDSGAPFALMECTLPEGSHTPFHRHDGEDEAFYVLEGHLRVHLGEGRVVEATAGSYVHLPKGTPHGFVALAPIRMLVLCGTDGFAEMVRLAGGPAERHELPPPGPPDVERLEAACERHGIALLGPLPE